MELPLDKVLSQPFVHYEGVQYTAGMSRSLLK